MSGRTKNNKKVWIWIVVSVLVVVLAVVIIAIALKPFGGDASQKGSKNNGVNSSNKNSNGSNSGEYITFGSYEQDNDTTNGKEDILWLVLKDEGDRVLVVSKNALDCQVYSEYYKKTSWSDSAIRTWLNNEFYNTAFSEDERAKIHTVDVTYDDIATGGVGITQDSIFLLSTDEVELYINSAALKQCQPTEYAVAQGAAVNDSNGRCWWWLRSSAEDADGYNVFYDAAGVCSDGTVDKNGFHVMYDYAGVRPAMWIDKIK